MDSANQTALEVVTINLDDHRSPGVEVFTGRDRGKAVRKAAKLDVLDSRPGSVEIVVPDDVYLLASSFWLGMFGPSVRLLGRDGFRAKYHFVGEDIEPVVSDGIDEALKYESPLPSSDDDSRRRG